jgi:beta-phosphoglucomutase-like phosphatase (HAD superfamily)
MSGVIFPDLGSVVVGPGGLSPREVCLDWRRGAAGVGTIAALADDSMTFIALETRTLAVVRPGPGPVAIYPVPPRRAARPAALCLDLDGTIVDSEPLWIAVIEQVVGALTGRAGFRFDLDERRHVSGRSVGAHLAWALAAHAPGVSLEAARALHARFAREALDRLSVGGRNASVPRVMPGFTSLRAAARDCGLPVALVTSGVETKMWPTLVAAFRAAGLGDPAGHFDAILCGGVMAGEGRIGSLSDMPMKPHPWLYAEALIIGLGLPETAAAVVIEDSAAGVVAARLAGLDVIGLDSGNIRQLGAASLCSTVVEDLTTAGAVVRKRARA